MTLTEKISYIRGLADGLKLDESKDEVKIINAIVDLLDDMAVSITDSEEFTDEMSAQLDEVDADLAELEEYVYDDECDECDDDCDCDDDNEYYEITCPSCGEEICIDEDVLFCGEMKCPNCGEDLEFDFEDLVKEDGCECGCGCCGDTDDSEDLMS